MSAEAYRMPGVPPSLEPPPQSPAAIFPGGGPCVELGRLRVAFSSEDPAWLDLARERLRAVSVSGAPDLEVEYRVVDRRRPDPQALFEARRRPLAARRRRGEALDLEGAGFRGSLDLAAGVASLEGPMATYPLDFLLQALWYEGHPRGLIVHGVALARGVDASLCAGPSGSGKSTLCGLFPERALSDEQTGVRLGGSAPRVDAFPDWPGQGGSAELSAICLLRHGAHHRRRRLAPSAALAELTTQVFWPTFDGRAVARTFETLCDLVEEVPIYRLHFRPDREVWRTLWGEGAP